MDPSGVLLALEEQKKWRERRERIKERIKQLERRTTYLERELARARKKVSEYNTMLGGLKDPLRRDRPVPQPAIR
jgi:chromosome segregation ATPase